MSGAAHRSTTTLPVNVRIAVDIGGTFTDGIAQVGKQGLILTAKELTTPQDPSQAVAVVVSKLLAQAAQAAQMLGGPATHQEVVHGTTLVTNAIMERKGPRTGLIVTQGTADTLRIAREMRYDLYDLDIELPQPLVERECIFEVNGRLNARGEEIEAITLDSLAQALAVMSKQGIESIGICLLHSYLNPVHEEAVASHLRIVAPKVSVSLSCRVANEMREYERMSTVAANAYVQPTTAAYLRKLRQSLEDVGAAGPLRIMVSSGGFTSDQSAADTPIVLLESGPAGGVLSALNTAALAGISDVLTFDMGGTTAKACVATQGVPSITYLFEAARARRFKKGSGLPILVPSIDLIEIGAGGGSIAYLSALGLLNVGPRSAGAAPGPACYGLGGLEPTVTDADLMLGYLDPENFLGGRMRLNKDLAQNSMASLAKSLQIIPMALAKGIFDVVNENMASAARVHVAEKGLDPRALTMVATGGAGPVHAVEVANKLGIRHILCSVAAGVGSCLGFLSAPARADRAWSLTQELNQVNTARLLTITQQLKDSVADELHSAGVSQTEVDFVLSADLRYIGQGHSISIEVPLKRLSEPDANNLPTELIILFNLRYTQLYGQTIPDGVLQVVTWRVSGRSKNVTQAFHLTSYNTAQPAIPKSYRDVYVPEKKAFIEVPIYDRYLLPAGTILNGPLLIQEPESTLVVARTAVVEVLPDMSLSITLPSS